MASVHRVGRGGVAFLLAALCLLALAASAGAQEVAPAPWENLFAEEGWYRQQAGEEQVFRGNLEAVAPPQAGTLMRNALYKLGDRTIYTGAKKLPALDGLTGKTVEISGKAVDMELSGQAVREIWPAAIRPLFVAAPAAQPEEMVLRSPIIIEKTLYSVLPRLSAEAGPGEKRDQAMRLLGCNGFAVIRTAAEEKVFIDRLAQAGLEVLIHKHQPAGPAPAWAGFEQGMLVVCWRDLFSADTLRIAGAEQTAGSGSGKRNTARLDLHVVRQEADRNVPTWKACGVWMPRVARLEVPGPGKDEIWRADATWGDVADGLQASLEVKQRRIQSGDDITLTMTLRNVRPAGDEPIRVWDNKYSNGYRADFYLVVAPDGQSRILRRLEQPAWDKNVPTPITIEPGKAWTLAGIANDAIEKSLKSLGLDTTQPGIYTITGYYEASKYQGDRVDRPGEFWGGQIAAPPIEVRVGEGKADAPPPEKIKVAVGDKPLDAAQAAALAQAAVEKFLREKHPDKLRGLKLRRPVELVQPGKAPAYWQAVYDADSGLVSIELTVQVDQKSGQASVVVTGEGA